MARAAYPGNLLLYGPRWWFGGILDPSARTACPGVVLSMARVVQSGVVGCSAHFCTLGAAWASVRVICRGVLAPIGSLSRYGSLQALGARNLPRLSLCPRLALAHWVSLYTRLAWANRKSLVLWLVRSPWVSLWKVTRLLAMGCAEALARVAGSDVATLLARVVVHGGRLGSSSRRGHGDREGVGSRNIIGRLVSSGSLRS